MNIVFLLFFLFTYIVLNTGFFWSLLKKQSTIFSLFYITYLWIYDWLFINLGYYLPSFLVFIMKSFQEIAIILVMFISFQKIILRKKVFVTRLDKIFLVCIFCPLILSIVHSIFIGHSIDSIIQGLRLYYLPIITPYIFYKYGIFQSVNIRSLRKLFYYLIILTVFFSIVQVVSFSGDLRELWFYRFFDILNPSENPIDIASFNYIRNDKLRATGLFVSSIILTTFFSITTVYVLLSFRIHKNLWWKACILLMLSFYGMYLTETRIGMISTFICIIYVMIFKINKEKLPKIYWLVGCSMVFVLLTFLSLVIGLIDDMSALGRLVQYANFTSEFNILGQGLGAESVLVLYDSFYISTILLCGIMFPLYVGFYLYLLNVCVKNLKVESSPEKTAFLLLSVIVGLSFIYAFAFQFMAGSFPFRLIFIMLFISISFKKNPFTLSPL